MLLIGFPFVLKLLFIHLVQCIVFVPTSTRTLISNALLTQDQKATERDSRSNRLGLQSHREDTMFKDGEVTKDQGWDGRIHTPGKKEVTDC